MNVASGLMKDRSIGFRRVSSAIAALILAVGPAEAATIDAFASFSLSLIEVSGPNPDEDIFFFQDAWPGSYVELAGAASGSANSDVDGYTFFPATPMEVNGSSHLDVTQSQTEVSSGFTLINNTLILDVFNRSATESYDFIYEWNWTVGFSGDGFPASGVTGILGGRIDDLCTSSSTSSDFEFTEADAPFSASYSGSCMKRFTLEPYTELYPDASFFQKSFAIGSRIEAAPVPLPAAGVILLSGLDVLGGLSSRRRRPS